MQGQNDFEEGGSGRISVWRVPVASGHIVYFLEAVGGRELLGCQRQVKDGLDDNTGRQGRA